MPHKIMIYTALLVNLAVDEFDFAAEIVGRTVESLHLTLVIHGDIYRSKNIMRLLGNLVQIGLVNSEAFCQFLLQFIEEYQKMPGSQEPTGCSSHSSDLILEVILASLPSTSAKLSKEQSIDFGTVLESLKLMFKGREKLRSESTLFGFSPMNGDISADILFKTWEVYSANTTKVFNSERILLSASRDNYIECNKKINSHAQQIMTLHPVFVTEFKDHAF